MAVGSIARAGLSRSQVRNFSTFGRDGWPDVPGNRAGVRLEDRRSTLQLAVPPVVITGGVLSALFGFFRTSWPWLPGGVLSALFGFFRTSRPWLPGGVVAISAGLALRSAGNRLKEVPSETPR